MTPSVVHVRVGIATRNRADILPQALRSALAQKWEPLSVMVIDDGSTDQTSTVAGKFPSVHWLQRLSHQGYIPARNELMNQPGVDYYVSLDDDAWFLEDDEIRTAVEFLQLNPRVGAVAFDVLTPDQPLRRQRSQPELVAKFIGCGHVLRIAALQHTGLYEQTPGGYGGEEKDLCFKLMDAGYAIVRLPGVHVWHDKTSVARESYSQHRSGVCNDLTVLLRRTPLLLLPLALLVKALRQLTFSWRTRQLRSCLSGIGLFAKSLPALWGSRKPVKMKTLRDYVRLSMAPSPYNRPGDT